MSQIKVNTIVDAAGGTTASINGYTPTMSNMAGRNRIINGAMMIDQRNAGASVTASNTSDAVYVVDRWAYRVLSGSKLSFQRSTVAPAGFTNSLLVTSLSSYSVANNEFFAVRQPIEGFNVADLGWGTANAQPIVISFLVRSSLTGTFGGGLWNSAENRFYVFSYTINSANTWEQKTITVAGDTSGTWATNNTTGLMVAFNLGSGGLYTGTPGSWGTSAILAPTGQVNVAGTNGATFYITGVQLEAGSVATPFEHRQYGQELALCQRYYQRINGLASDYVTLGVGIVASSTVGNRLTFPMLAAMRAAPTLDVLSTSLYDLSVVSAVTSLSSPHSTPNSYSIDLAASGGGLTTYRPCVWMINVGASNYAALSAEL